MSNNAQAIASYIREFECTTHLTETYGSLEAYIMRDLNASREVAQIAADIILRRSK